MRRSLWILVSGIVVVLAWLAMLSLISNLDQESSTETFDGVTRVVFDLENSPIEFTASEDVVVDVAASTGFMGGEARVDQEGQTLLIYHECPPFLALGCRASFQVALPPESEISGTTSNGPISLISIDGAISVATSNGAITADDVSSSLALRTSNGPITGTDISSEDVEVSTSNGGVRLGFVIAPASVRAATSNGPIEVLLPEDAPAYAVRTSTSNGRVATDVRTDPDASGSIDAMTSNGDISIRYQPG